MIPGTKPMRIAVSTSSRRYTARAKKKRHTKNNNVNGLRRSQNASSAPAMTSAAYIHAGAFGAPPRAAAACAASAWLTEYAISLSKRRHASRHAPGSRSTRDESSSAHSTGRRDGVLFRSTSAPSSPWSSGREGTRLSTSAFSMAACERASFSGSYTELAAFPDWTSFGSRSRDTATSAKTRAASLCAVAFAFATSSTARHVFGKPRESFEKHLEKARFINSTTFCGVVISRVFKSAASNVFLAATATSFFASSRDRPYSDTQDVKSFTCFSCRSLTSALTPSQRSAAASSSADATAEETERSIARSRPCTVSATRSARAEATRAVMSFSNVAEQRATAASNASSSFSFSSLAFSESSSFLFAAIFFPSSHFSPGTASATAAFQRARASTSARSLISANVVSIFAD